MSIAGQMETRFCPLCGDGFLISVRPGRPQVWCSDQCKYDAYASRRAAGKQSRPVHVVTVPTERVKYTKVPIRELKTAIVEDPKLAVNLAKTLQKIAENSYSYETQSAIRHALIAAGNATLETEKRRLDRKAQDLKEWRARLNKRQQHLEQQQFRMTV